MRHAVLLALCAVLAACASAPQGTMIGSVATPALWPVPRRVTPITDARTEERITELMARMTLEEKVGQVIQPDIGSVTPRDFAAYSLGSVLVGGGGGPGGDDKAAPAAWLDMVRAYQNAATSRPGAAVPILFGIDGVHGHNNLVGAVVFPHNIGLGAADDPDLMRRIGEATAEEIAATGMHWTFAPAVSVPQDPRWGRTYEGFSSDPARVARLARPVIEGLQGLIGAGPARPGRVAATAKHFIADGGTVDGDDQGDARLSERELIDTHAAGYVSAVEAGVLTVMASYSSWNGRKMHGSRSLLTDVLKARMGFQGVVVGDWNGHEQVPGCTQDSCPEAFNAGIDIFMVPQSWRALYANTLEQVRTGVIAPERLDDAVRRILRVKVRMGLFPAEGPLDGRLSPDRPAEGRFDRIGSPDHRALAREAVRKSLVLLTNDGVLPIRSSARVLVAGDAADSVPRASGGWTITWQGDGTTNADFPNGQTIWDGIREAVQAGGGQAVLRADGAFDQRPDVAVVVFGEQPYAEFEGDRADLDFVPGAPLDLLRRLRAQGVPTVAVFLSGRPMAVEAEMAASNAFVAAWLPGSEGGGVADVLVGDAQGRPRGRFDGRLPMDWPAGAAPMAGPRFRIGHGLRYR